MALFRDLGIDDIGDGVAGAVFVSLHDDADVTLIWFRDEHSLSVHWGGDPGQARIIDQSGSFSARKSFAQFTENVRGQCLPWTPEELDSAAELGSLIEIEALREREAFAQTILNSSPQHMAILDAEGVIISVNEAWSRYARLNTTGAVVSSVGVNYRSTCARAIGRPFGDEAAQALTGIEAVLNGAAPNFTLDYPCYSPQEARWFRMTVYPMIAPATGAVVAHEDITARINDALAVETANERAALAVHGGGIGIWDLTIDSGSLRWDPQMYRLYGMSPRQQIANLDLWRNSVHPLDLANAERALAASINTGTPFESEFRVVWADGSVHHIRSAGELTHDPNGHATRMIGTNLNPGASPSHWRSSTNGYASRCNRLATRSLPPMRSATSIGSIQWRRT